MYTKIHGVLNSFRRDRILSVMIGVSRTCKVSSLNMWVVKSSCNTALQILLVAAELRPNKSPTSDSLLG